MDVFDLSSQEEFSPMKPLTKRPRKCFNQASDTLNQSSDKQSSGTLTVETSSSCDVKSDKPEVNLTERVDDIKRTSVSTEDANFVTDKTNIQGTNGAEVNSGDNCDRDCRKPVYIYDQELVRRCDAMPKIINRVGIQDFVF